MTVEVSKLHPTVAIGADAGQVAVSKMAAYVLLVPGDENAAPVGHRAIGQAQIFRKRSGGANKCALIDEDGTALLEE